MQYDIALKELLRHCHAAILRDLLGLPITASSLIEERPRETASVRRSDFVLRVVQEDGEEYLVLIEFQTYWEPNMGRRMLEYRSRHVLREGLDAITVLILIIPSPSATDHYQDREVDYRYRLIRLYELDAAEFIREQKLCLLPLVPLMRGGVELAREADEIIVKSELAEQTKADMLTAMTLLSGLVSEELVLQLMNRRRDIMMQSIGYELIKKEGLEEGLKEGYKKGYQEGLEQGIEQGIERGREEGLMQGIEQGIERGREEGLMQGIERGREEGRREGLLRGMAIALELKFGVEGLKLMPEIKEIEDLDILEIIEQAIRTAATPDELRELYRR